jgi:hypothetical protein
MTTASESKPTFERTRVGLVVAAAVMLVVAIVESALKITGPISEAMFAIGGLVPTWVGFSADKRNQDPRLEIASMTAGRIERPVAFTVGTFALIAIVLDSAGGVLEVFLLAYGAFNTGTYYFVLALEALLIFMIAVRTARFLSRRPIIWFLVGAGMFLGIRLVLIAIVTVAGGLDALGIGLTLAVASGVITSAAIFGLACLAYLWSRRRQQEFVVARLFRALPSSDKSEAFGALSRAALPPSSSVAAQHVAVPPVVL